MHFTVTLGHHFWSTTYRNNTNWQLKKNKLVSPNNVVNRMGWYATINDCSCQSQSYSCLANLQTVEMLFYRYPATVSQVLLLLLLLFSCAWMCYVEGFNDVSEHFFYSFLSHTQRITIFQLTQFSQNRKKLIEEWTRITHRHYTLVETIV